MKLDGISTSNQSQPKATQGNPASNSKIPPALAVAPIHLLVQEPSFGREAVLTPPLLDVDKSALPLAEHQVLESGERQELGF